MRRKDEGAQNLIKLNKRRKKLAYNIVYQFMPPMRRHDRYTGPLEAMKRKIKIVLKSEVKDSTSKKETGKIWRKKYQRSIRMEIIFEY